MASRREQKQQARAARVAAAEAASAAALRRRRSFTLGGITAVAAIVVGFVIVLGSGSSAKAPQAKAQAAHTYSQVERVLTGLSQQGTQLGDASAKVTVTYVGDLECPECSVFTLTVLPKLITDDVRTGRVKVTYRSLCTATCHFNTPRFIPQQVAAYAAGEQGLFWQYAELFYREQGDETRPYATEDYLRRIARQIPALQFRRWMLDRGNPSLLSEVQGDQRLLTRLGVPAQTPELLLSGPKGSTYLPAGTAPTLDWINQAISAVS